MAKLVTFPDFAPVSFNEHRKLVTNAIRETRDVTLTHALEIVSDIIEIGGDARDVRLALQAFHLKLIDHDKEGDLR